MSSFPLFDRREDPAASRVWTVSELTTEIRSLLGEVFTDVCVAGEISGLSRPRSGHVYFQIKDDGAQIRAVLFKGDARNVVFDLENGQAVRAYGTIDVYATRGEYQLIVRQMEPEGIGALELAFRQVVARLSAEGLFEPRRKRPLPFYPRRIVVVTSPSGAAVRDFLQVSGRRWPAAEILIVPSRVQGPGAAAELAEAIHLANRVADVDFLVLARGGGSLEDLWAFNEEIVARAIFGSRLPVVSAVGHEVDVTVSDLVADFRALTPTDAAARCVPDAEEIRAGLDSIRARLGRAVAEPSRRARLKLDSLRDRLNRAALEPGRNARQKLDLLRDRLQSAWIRDLDRRRQSLGRVAAQLDALSPLQVLGRGYSLTLMADGRTVVRNSADLAVGDVIHTRLARGSVASRVVSLDKSDI